MSPSPLLKISLAAAAALLGAVQGGESLRPPSPAGGAPAAATSSGGAREYAVASSITSTGSLVLGAAPSVPRQAAAVAAAPTQSDLDFLSSHGLPADSGRKAGSETYGSLGMPHVPGSGAGSGWNSASAISSTPLNEALPHLPPEVRGELVTFGEARTPAAAPASSPPARTALPQQPPPQPAQSYDPLPRRLADMSRYDRIAMQPYPDYDALPLHEKERLYTRQFVYMRNRRPLYSPETMSAIRRSETHGVPHQELYDNRTAGPGGDASEVKMENLRTKGLALPKQLLRD